jgi:small-conductance mechanosensitive channel
MALGLVLLSLAVIPSPAAPSDGGNDAQTILSFLNQSVIWYHRLILQQALATEPADMVFLDDNRQLADQIVRLSFDFARARARAISSGTSETTQPPDSQPANRAQALSASVAKADQQVKELQGEIDGIRRKLETAAGRKRSSLQAALSETQSEQQLAEARRQVLQNMLSFVSGSAAMGGTGTLQSQIDELARTIPAAAGEKTTGGGTTASSSEMQVAANTKSNSTPTGILGLVSDLVALHRKSAALDGGIRDAEQLNAAALALRAPLVTEVKQLTAQGDQIVAQPDATDPAVLAQQKQQLDSLTAQFKQLSAAILPLAKQSILIDLYKRNVANWRSSVQGQYRAQLKSLILRLVLLGIVLALIATMAEVWKKATFRYVHDVRRRYQFLLLRRIVVWMVVTIVVAAAFASELGTLFTFAGLLTAGVAIALQNVILSVAGYFFLIGKYGVRAGDRIQVAGVTGDVIDVGLIRLHLMEVSAGGTDARATGRVVVFSNAVVFQPNAGLFKQIPGTNFVWHEISLTLTPDSNYHQVEERMMQAVNSVYQKYKDRMEAQRRNMEQNLSGISVRPLDPESRVRLTQTGLEVVIRYPLDLSNAAQIDDDMARAMLEAIGKEPRLRLVGTGTPNIQPVTDGKAA